MESKIIHNEECRVIKGFERYYISESGKIYRCEPKNLKEKALIANGAKYLSQSKVHFRVLNGKLRQGFCSLTRSDGKLVNVAVAPIIVKAFELNDGKFDYKIQGIDYKDKNKRNLHISNLVIVDKLFGNYKLTESDVKQIKKLIKEKTPLRQISKMYGVSDMQINRIKTGENWGNGKRKIKAPTAPFFIEDGKIRKYIAIFNHEPAPPEIRRPFTIKRNPDDPTDNLILGILKGYKLTLKHKNITRAQVNIDKLNKYFFNL